MGGFQLAKSELAFLKAGIMGFSGAGKTFTAKELAIGLHQYCVAAKVMKKTDPIYFLDTETGSHWLRKDFETAGISLMSDKTRQFIRLVPAIREVSQVRGILIIDSVTHFWRELCDSYAKKKGRQTLRFDDWAWLKAQWSLFTDELVNSSCHLIMCGRAGFEYDMVTNEDTGKKDLTKTGIKMKAEGETAYEPSILILMERIQEMKEGSIVDTYREGRVLKDRGNVIDGCTFRNPTFQDFLPHIQCLNLGGEHVGVVTTETSEGIVPPNNPSWKKEAEEKEVVLDEIMCHLLKLYPSTKAADKQAKGDLLEKHFGSRSWERVKTIKLYELQQGLLAMTGTQPSTTEQAADLF